MKLYRNSYFSLTFKDEESLTFLKGKFPQSAIMFVCNKVDITQEARQFDKDDDEEEDEDEDEDEDDVNSSEANQTHNAEDKTEDKGKKFSQHESNL